MVATGAAVAGAAGAGRLGAAAGAEATLADIITDGLRGEGTDVLLSFSLPCRTLFTRY